MKFDFSVKEKRKLIGTSADGSPIYEFNADAVIADDVPLDEANLLTSRHKFGRARNNGKGVHRVVLDLDYDAALIPSSTPGHHHLILDVAMEWDEYEKLLTALAEAGVIEKNYAKASIAKGYSAIRTPWEKKKEKVA